MGSKYKILFVCTGNTCRSPMAEAALRVLLDQQRPNKFEVLSAGTGAASGYPATRYATEAVKVWSGDLSEHVSQQLSPSLIQESDLILAMGPEHYKEILRMVPSAIDKAYLFKNFPDPAPVGDGVDDPIGQSLDRYNETFLEIGEYLGKNLQEFIRRIDSKPHEA